MFISLILQGNPQPIDVNITQICSVNGNVVKMSNNDIIVLEPDSLKKLKLAIAPKSKGVKNNDPDDELLDLFNTLNSLLKRDKAKFTLQREKKLKELLSKHRLDKEDLIKAATNIGNSDWMQGKNEQKTVYAKIDYLLRPDKAQEWAEREPEKKKGMF